MAKGRKLQVKESEITVISQQNIDYISLTDMTVTFREGSGLIGKWITNKNTIEYLGVWEKVNNPDLYKKQVRTDLSCQQVNGLTEQKL
jgi:hypothetical protein